MRLRPLRPSGLGRIRPARLRSIAGRRLGIDPGLSIVHFGLRLLEVGLDGLEDRGSVEQHRHHDVVANGHLVHNPSEVELVGGEPLDQTVAAGDQSGIDRCLRPGPVGSAAWET